MCNAIELIVGARGKPKLGVPDSSFPRLSYAWAYVRSLYCLPPAFVVALHHLTLHIIGTV